MNVRKGFTLIELLVVIAIIAILAAILFPVFAKVREKARQASCASNEKQLALGVIQYVQDYDEKFPAVWDTNRSPNINWGQEIYPYVKSLQVYVCPSNVLAAAQVTGNQFMGNGFGQESPQSNIPVSYAMNGDLGFLNGGQTNFGPYKAEAGINEPASKVMITECIGVNSATHWPGWFSLSNPSDPTSSTIYNNLFAGHTGFMNVAYIDGHVKAMSPVSLMTPVNQFGLLAPGEFPSSTDSACQGNPTDAVQGVLAINCDDVDPTAVSAMAGLAKRYQ